MTDEDRKKYLAFLSFTQSQQQNYFGGLLNGRAEGKIEGRIEGIEIGIEKGKIEGKIEGKADVVRNCLKKGFNIQTICEITQLDENEVNNIIAQADKDNG